MLEDKNTYGSSLTDDQLLAIAVSGNQMAINALISRYKYIVIAIARSYFFNNSDMEDLIQEGMIAIFNAITNYKPMVAFKTYVYTCVKNRMLTLVKQYNAQKNKPLNNYISLSGFTDGDSDKNQIMIDQDCGPEESFLNSEAESELKEIIVKSLSRFEYLILVYYLKGYSYRELSDIFNKNEKAVDNALQRIRKKLLLVLDK